MSNRDEFSLDEDFETDGSDEDSDRFIVVPDGKKKGVRRTNQAAWSRLEDVLAERRLQRELSDYLEGDEA